ncbi:hypothetical protein TNCV_4725941 [Trichonephila clavipes]|nr:hypothetical protein TNCV_4725941 [Trichonephila clavipes]
MLELEFSSDFKLSCEVEKYFENFDGEVASIFLAVDKIEQWERKNIVFFVDSKAAITALTTTNHRYNSRICKEKKMLNIKNCIKELNPSHYGIYETARARYVSQESIPN